MKSKAEKIVIRLTVLILICIVGLTLYIKFGEEIIAMEIFNRENSAANNTESSVVSLEIIERGDMEKSVNGKGVVTQNEYLSIEMPLDGIVKEIFIRNGLLIDIGDALYELDAEDLQEQLDDLNDAERQKILQIGRTSNTIQRVSVRAPASGIVRNMSAPWNASVRTIVRDRGYILKIVKNNGNVVRVGENVPSGRIRNRRERNGNRVAQGDVLFTMDIRINNINELYIDLGEIRADIKEIKAYIENPIITAEVSGIISNIMIADDTQLVDEDKILDISLLEGYTMNINVMEDDLSDVYIGQDAVIEMDTGFELTGEVSFINQVSPNYDGEFEVEVLFDNSSEIKNGDVKPGMEGMIRIYIERKENILKVPLETLFSDSDGEYVMIYTGAGDIGEYEVTDIPSEKRYITKGFVSELYAEITDGVEEGDTIIAVRTSNEAAAKGSEGKNGKGAWGIIK